MFKAAQTSGRDCVCLTGLPAMPQQDFRYRSSGRREISAIYSSKRRAFIYSAIQKTEKNGTGFPLAKALANLDGKFSRKQTQRIVKAAIDAPDRSDSIRYDAVQAGMHEDLIDLRIFGVIDIVCSTCGFEAAQKSLF
jgi:hypothetical protein